MTFLAAQERQIRRADQRPVRGERSAAEGSGDNGAAAENSREEELPTGGEDLQPEQDSSRPKPLASPITILPLQMLMMHHTKCPTTLHAKRECPKATINFLFMQLMWTNATNTKKTWFSAACPPTC